MTRTAADVEAEHDAKASHFDIQIASARAEYERAWVQHRYEDARDIRLRQEAIGRQRQQALAGLLGELIRARRAELDAATPPDVRATALRLRAAHRSVDGWAMGAEDPWEALDTAEAAAWAAVAREAGR